MGYFATDFVCVEMHNLTQSVSNVGEDQLEGIIRGPSCATAEFFLFINSYILPMMCTK